MHFGRLLGPTLETFSVLSVICGAKLAGSSQVPLFEDPLVEMLPECDGCMCFNQSKNCCFGDLEAPFWVPGMLVIQGSKGSPNRHLEVQV